jgi:hypothetical protein
MTFVISLIFFYYLFRFFYTKKEYRRSKIIYAFLSGGSFFLLFATVGAWIFLYQKIGAADFVNPNGGVILYDNEKLLSKNFKDSAKITDYSNMV